MTRVKIKLFANLREAAGVREAEFEGPDLPEVLKGLTIQYPKLDSLIFTRKTGSQDLKIHEYINILINGINIFDLEGLESQINEGDEIAIFPPVSGG